jgi:NAD(P)-dependent dehydrogenase (short-subunit alcohol dehydrogenase family)
MAEMRFDGRVAIVTGAGAAEGLGRADARLLASRGAKVVVNDLGSGPDGLWIERAHAERVAAEIRDEGGDAVADTNSVAEEASAKAIVQTALDAYGRVDILVNNAGVVRFGEFGSNTSDDIEQMVAAHLMGNIWMCRAVWPHMREQNYGRIVNVTSLASWGISETVVYGATKAGVLGLTRGLAVEGAANNIRVNGLAPHAHTTAFYYFDEAAPPGLEVPPEAVAAVVAYLCHEECLLKGAYAAAGGGYVALGVFGATAGYDCGLSITPEDVRDNLAAIRNTSGFKEFGVPGGRPGIHVARNYERRAWNE